MNVSNFLYAYLRWISATLVAFSVFSWEYCNNAMIA